MAYYGIFRIAGRDLSLVACQLNYAEARARVRDLNAAAGYAAYTYQPYSL